MIIFYIIISVLWGILLFLTTFKEYKWYIAIIFSIVSVVIWPLFIVAAIVVEIIKLCKNKKKNNLEDTIDNDMLVNYIKENIIKNGE